MGFIRNIIGGLFGGGSSPSIEPPKLTGRDILGSTQAVAPEAPELGTQKRKRGRSSLIIDKEKETQASNNSYKSLNI